MSGEDARSASRVTGYLQLVCFVGERRNEAIMENNLADIDLCIICSVTITFLVTFVCRLFHVDAVNAEAIFAWYIVHAARHTSILTSTDAKLPPETGLTCISLD